MSSPFLIVGVGRSGTTSLATIVNLSSDVHCEIEPYPNLIEYCRKMREKSLANPLDLIHQTLGFRFNEINSHSDSIYGEKNVTYAPFMSLIAESYDCKFIFVYRDGRDVVSSFLNWNNNRFGSIYREANSKTSELSLVALQKTYQLRQQFDFSDHMRPRPCYPDISHEGWLNRSRLEMCAYYWSTENLLYLTHLNKLPKERYFLLSYSSVSSELFASVFDFLEVTNRPSDAVITDVLDSRVNSLGQRNSTLLHGSIGPLHWLNWSSSQRAQFEAIAYQAMTTLGFYKSHSTRWKPISFGSCWNEASANFSWYKNMFESRMKVHKQMMQLFDSLSHNHTIHSICDIGCGIGYGYTDFFANYEYTGIDVSKQNIDWSLNNLSNPKHNFVYCDFIETPLRQVFDFVFSSGTIDNTYDIEQYICAMVDLSCHWIYITAYRGWYPDLMEHRYSYNEQHACFYNYISPSLLRSQLLTLGCTSISIKPIPSSSKECPIELEIFACVPR